MEKKVIEFKKCISKFIEMHFYFKKIIPSIPDSKIIFRGDSLNFKLNRSKIKNNIRFILSIPDDEKSDLLAIFITE